MKVVLGALAIMALVIGAPLAYAQVGSTASMTSTDPGQLSELPHSDHPQAAYLSGFQHGVIDGNSSSNVISYIDQPKHGFAWHSSEFVKGYVNGYCSIPANKDVGTDDDRAAFYCPDGPSSAKWFIGKHEPITEGVVVATYGIPSAGVNVTYQYDDKTSGSSGSETTMVKENGTMHFLGSTAELVGFYPGDKMTVSVSQCITHLNAYGYPECISQPILDNKTITLGETGGIVSLDLSKSAIPLVTSGGETGSSLPLAGGTAPIKQAPKASDLSPSGIYSPPYTPAPQFISTASPVYKTNNSSSDVSALVNKATALYDRGNYTQAMHYYDKALAIDPNEKHALDGKGIALRREGNYTQAIHLFEKALAVDPKDKYALNGKGNALYSQGKYLQAMQYFDKALAVDPNYIDVLYDKGVALYSLGNFSQAIQYYDKALAIDPKYKLALNHKGSVLYSLGNYTQAIQSFDKSLAIDPNYEDALNNKGAALYSLGNFSQAIQYYDKALAIDPKDTQALTNKGNALSSQGNDAQAIQSFDKALSIDPKDTHALINKGIFLNTRGNYTQAIQFLDKALAIDPNEKHALTGKGYALSGQGNYTQAIQYYDKALSIDANDTYALNGKSKALNGQGDALHYQGNYTQAIQYYDKALAIDPKDIYALDAIGKVFADQSNYTRAIQYYDKGLAVNSTDAGLLFDKQNAISEIVKSGNTSGYDRGCIDAQISNPSERYINQSINGSSFHSEAFMQVYNEGFDACSSNLPKRVETLKMFNVIVLKGNVTDETANTRICTTVSEDYPQTLCQNLDNLNPENNSSVIESKVFTFDNVPVNASFHSCIQRLIYPNVTLCDNYGSTNNQGPTVEQIRLPFFERL